MHGSDHEDALLPLVEEGWLDEFLFEVKSGKEATVLCCRAGARALETGLINCASPLAAVKVHRPLEMRRFRNDGAYLAGRLHLVREGRVKRAAMNKSSFGRQVQYGTWLHHEFEVMRALAEAGLPVPEPLVMGERAIVMPFIGDEAGPAPSLHDATLSRDDVHRTVDDLFDLIAAMLDLHCVHGDLSPYNILWHRGEPVIIDFPQSIDPRLHPGALDLLSRDVQNITRWAAKHGVRRDGERFTRAIWRRFVMGEIG